MSEDADDLLAVLELIGRAAAAGRLLTVADVAQTHAREALLRAGTTLVHEFRAATLASGGVELAQALVPAGFEQAITPRIASISTAPRSRSRYACQTRHPPAASPRRSSPSS